MYRKFFQSGGLVQVEADGDDGDRILDLDGVGRVDVFDLFALPLDVDGLVLIADQHVAGALQEDVGGFAAGAGTGS